MFKVGDKVRIKSFFNNRFIVGFEIGTTAIISQISSCSYMLGDGYYFYAKLDTENVSTYDGGFYLSELELVEKPKKVIKQFGIVKFMENIK